MKFKRTHLAVGAAVLLVGVGSGVAVAVNATSSPSMVVSAVDNYAGSANSEVTAAASRMGMSLTSGSRATLVASVAGEKVYLVKDGDDRLCVIRVSSEQNAGSCGSRSQLLSTGVYLITGRPGDFSAIVVTPDGISSASVSDGASKASNNVAILKLDGSDSGLVLTGVDGTRHSIDLGALMPPPLK
ncbi:hypothetical protein [Nakamurella lactea]|uniref:hypothetical protein n=1 Tax=Nakamurella lactea TaxID=459515 RepID=UPI0012B596B4|nr:hypothetical protein [Nakamurella lactea]